MEIKYEDILKIRSAMQDSYDAMCNADFEFECEEEADEYYESLENVREVLNFLNNLV